MRGFSQNHRNNSILPVAFLLLATNALQVEAQPRFEPLSTILHFWAQPLDIELDRGFAYIATGQEIQCWDISEPDHPDLVSYVALSGVREISAIIDTIMWVRDGGNAYAIDISDPFEMTTVSHIGGINGSFAVSDSFAIYSGVEYYPRGQWYYSVTWFNIFDITNISNPRVLFNVVHEDELGNGFPDLEFGTNYCINGQLLYRLFYGDEAGLSILDFSDSARLVELDPPGIQVFPSVINHEGNTLVGVAGGRGNFISLVDIRDPGDIQVSADLPEIDSVADVSLDRNRIYSVRGANGIAITDISNPEEPEILFNGSARTNGRRISAEESLMSIIDNQYVVELYSTTDPSDPEFIGNIDNRGVTEDLALVGDLVCLATGIAGLRIVDYSDPNVPRQIGTWSDGERVVRVAADEDICITVNADTSFSFFDISGNGDPDLRSTIIGREINGAVLGIILYHDYLYVADDRCRILIYECSDPNNPNFIGQLNLDGQIRRSQNLKLEGNNLQVYCSDRVLFFDLEAPDSPRLIRSFLKPIALNCLIEGRFLHRIAIEPNPDYPGNGSVWYHIYDLFDISDADTAIRLDRLLLSEEYSDHDFPSQIYSIEAVSAANSLISTYRTALSAYTGYLGGINDRPVAEISLPYTVKNLKLDIERDIAYVLSGSSIHAYHLHGSLAVPFQSVVKPPSILSLTPFPNPFNSSTTISYTLPKPGRYALDVVDIQGRLVTRLADGWKEAGSYRSILQGGELPSGTFMLRLNGADASAVQKVELVK